MKPAQDRGRRRPRGGDDAPRRRTPRPRAYVPGPGAITVLGLQDGVDLAHFLAERFPRIGSVRQVRRALDRGLARVNGRVESFGSRRLHKGDIVEFDPRQAAIATSAEGPRCERRRILLDEAGVVVYDKPAGLPVTPTDSGKGPNLLAVLEPTLGELFPVHRLDADTTGAVALVRTRELQRTLEEAFRSRAVAKTYHALVRGIPKDEGEWRSRLVCRGAQPGQERWASGDGPGALSALTRWTVEQRFTHGSLVRVEPLTGRFHQVRIHFSEMGFPLFGDRTYGDRADPVPVARHMLHASRLEFPHPTQPGRRLTVNCPLPADFRIALKELDRLK